MIRKDSTSTPIHFYLSLAGMICFFFLSLLLISLKFYTDYRVRETERLYPPLGDFVEIEGVRLHYLREGEGTPFVFFHGGFGSVYDFSFSLFREKHPQMQFIAFDRPGHGYSQRPAQEISIFDQARYLQGAIRKLGIEKPVIVGHSLGGAVALAYVLEYGESVSALVLISSYVTPYEGPPHPMHRIPAIPILGRIYLSALVNPLGSMKIDGIGEKVFFPNKAPQGYLDASSSLALRPSHFRANAEDIRHLPQGLRRIHDRLEEIRLPVFLITGDSDRVALPERHAYRLKQRLPHARLFEFPDTGHQPAFVKPAEVLDILKLARKAGEISS